MWSTHASTPPTLASTAAGRANGKTQQAAQATAPAAAVKAVAPTALVPRDLSPQVASSEQPQPFCTGVPAALADRTGTNAPTIRYYEKIGLLPSADRQEGGQRIYGDAD